MPSTASPHPFSSYRPEVDGLRAIAVLSVILFHASFEFARGGFVGVDVFFVISGFLITGILLEELDAGTFRIDAFYARRARRILPALAVMLTVCALAAWWLLPQAQMADYFRLMMSVALFHANLRLGLTTGYFDGPADERPLLHTWSLGVEEQYYFLLPLLLFKGWRWGKSRLLSGLLMLAAASLALSEIGWRHAESFNFFFTPSRIWELLLGSGAAFVLNAGHQPPAWMRKPWLVEAMMTSGLIAVLASVVMMSRHTPSPSLYMLVPTLGTALILLGAGARTLTTRLLSLKPLVGIGLISYSVYLWHQPLLAFARLQSLQPLTLGERSGLVAGALLLGALSWRFVEQPIRKMRTLPHRTTLLWTLACTLMLTLLAMAGQLLSTPRSSGAPASVTASFAPPKRTTECFDIPYAHNKSDHWMCDINPGTQAPSFMLFGDSHALQVLDAVTASAREARRSGVFAGFSGCAPFLNTYPLVRADQAKFDCHALNQRVFDYVREHRIRDVILVAKWSYYTAYWNGSTYLNALGLAPGDPVSLEHSRRAFRQGFQHTLTAYEQLGVRVHVVEQAPQQRLEPDVIYDRAWSVPGGTQELLRELSTPRAMHRALQAYPASVFREIQFPGTLDLVNLDDLYCDTERCLVGTPEQSRYQDMSHLSAEGARRAVPTFTQMLRANAP